MIRFPVENDGKIKFLVLVELAEVVQLTDPRDKPMPDIRVRQIITNSGKKGLKKSDGFETVPTFISFFFFFLFFFFFVVNFVIH